MKQENVYDLGDLDSPQPSLFPDISNISPVPPADAAAAPPGVLPFELPEAKTGPGTAQVLQIPLPDLTPEVAPAEPARPARPAAPRAAFPWAITGSLSLLVPGAGQLVHRDARKALLLFSSLSLLGAAGWALLAGMQRLVGTLELYALPRGLGFWTLGVLFAAAAIIHVTGVLTARDPAASDSRCHPVLAGAASFVVPGWGQVLNGNPARAGLFLGSLWLLGGAWLVLSPAATALLVSFELGLPWAGNPLAGNALWAAAAVVWSLAVYDAALSAAYGEPQYR